MLTTERFRRRQRPTIVSPPPWTPRKKIGRSSGIRSTARRLRAGDQRHRSRR
jgi:hypothetical protein